MLKSSHGSDPWFCSAGLAARETRWGKVENVVGVETRILCKYLVWRTVYTIWSLIIKFLYLTLFDLHGGYIRGE